MYTSVPGYPRIGKKRELKFACEDYFAKRIDRAELEARAAHIRKDNWLLMRDRSITHIPSNDFSLYDGFLDTAILFGIAGTGLPESPRSLEDLSETDKVFALARGEHALPLRKWYNTNYHYLVPRIDDGTHIVLSGDKPLREFREAKALGIITRPGIIGPFTLLKRSSYAEGARAQNLAGDLITAYTSLLGLLHQEGACAIQFIEPELACDLSPEDTEFFRDLYESLFAGSAMKAASWDGGLHTDLHVPYGDLRDCWKEAMSLPFSSFSLDFVEGEENINLLVAHGFPDHATLTAGIISGKSVWKANSEHTNALIERIEEASGCNRENGRLGAGISCSLLHVPVTAQSELGIPNSLRDRLSFAEEKLSELEAAENDPNVETSIRRPYVRPSEESCTRLPSRQKRKTIQRARFNFPPLPATTIGSFPQTKGLRQIRAAYRKGESTKEEYEKYVRAEIERCVRFQERIGLDVLVHGEAERTDMVEFFASRLEGFTVTDYGWVQSYGTRCVKPPIVTGSVRRKEALTVSEIVYAQSLTAKPVKGMLTGPVTILNWSFPAGDIPLEQTAFEIAAAIREEVLELEARGIGIIQIDEAALKEKVPLRKADRHRKYLDWALPAFRYTHAGCRADTNIHTHMCYSDFTDLVTEIDYLDADVITFEAARSDFSLLDTLRAEGFQTDVGPGVYDIHSPVVPETEELVQRIQSIQRALGRTNTRYDGLWINPDCGLKTRDWEETERSLENMVEAVRRCRANSRAQTEKTDDHSLRA